MVILCIICNNISNKTLPHIWLLIIGFVLIVYANIYTIKFTQSFVYNIQKSVSKDKELLSAREKLLIRLNSKINWFIILLVPALIVPVVIYIIKYPLGLPIKIFAYTALYIIISLCIICYIRYIYFIMLSYDLARNAEKIKEYNINHPHKTQWIMKIATLTNKQSNLFFLVGAGFVFLLYQITFSGQYGVELYDKTTKIIIVYLWGIVALAIVIMFPTFSLYSYYFIKQIINKLTAKSLHICEVKQNDFIKEKNKQRRQMLILLNELKMLILEKTPTYPQKPLLCYAVSYIIAILNFIATVDATISLYEYFQ